MTTQFSITAEPAPMATADEAVPGASSGSRSAILASGSLTGGKPSRRSPTRLPSCGRVTRGVGEHLPNERDDFGAVQLNGAHDRLVGKTDHAVFEIEAGGTQAGQV